MSSRLKARISRWCSIRPAVISTPLIRNHRAPVTRFPVPHLTQYDFGDLAGPRGKPYAVYPDAKTRVVEQVSVRRPHTDSNCACAITMTCSLARPAG